MAIDEFTLEVRFDEWSLTNLAEAFSVPWRTTRVPPLYPDAKRRQESREEDKENQCYSSQHPQNQGNRRNFDSLFSRNSSTPDNWRDQGCSMPKRLEQIRPSPVGPTATRHPPSQENGRNQAARREVGSFFSRHPSIILDSSWRDKSEAVPVAPGSQNSAVQENL